MRRMPALPLLFFASITTLSAQALDPVEIVRVALANNESRTVQAREYEYRERDSTTVINNVGGKNFDLDTYEIMVIDGGPYRRRVEHNGVVIAPEDERQEREEYVAEGRAKADATMKEGFVSGRRVLSFVVYGNETPRLSFNKLLLFFNFRLLKQESLDERITWVIEAAPKHGQKPSDEIPSDIRTFKMKIWIDQAENQIMRVEATAIHPGMLGGLQYATVDPKCCPYPRDVERALYDGCVQMYARGTVITMDWRKIDDEVWLPTRTHIKGKLIHSYPRSMPWGAAEGLAGASTEAQYEKDTVYLEYKKFGVTHRLLFPDSH